MINIVVHSNGEVLTGRLWRKDHAFLHTLPFYSNIAKVDDLAALLVDSFPEGLFKTLLIVRLKPHALHSDQTDCCILIEICERIGRSSSVL
jgi:hypothetical protein